MGFRNAAAWKAAMKQYAKQNNISVADVQQRYILDEFASKIADSSYSDSLVLKGGFVVSNLLGIDNRTTRDIDMTFSSTIYSKEEIENILETVMGVENNTFFNFKILSIQECQVDDGNPGFSVTLEAVHERTSLKMKLDISNNTLIFPRAIGFTFESMFTGEKIGVMSYPVENIIAEKFETTLDRGVFNTRMRDLFDIVLLMDTQKHLIDMDTLCSCIIEVSKERGTLENLYYFDGLISQLADSSVFNDNFEKYKKKMYPDSQVTLDGVFDVFTDIYQNLKHMLPEREVETVEERLESAGERAARRKQTYSNNLDNKPPELTFDN